jgi:hypothetical protein
MTQIFKVSIPRGPLSCCFCVYFESELSPTKEEVVDHLLDSKTVKFATNHQRPDHVLLSEVVNLAPSWPKPNTKGGEILVPLGGGTTFVLEVRPIRIAELETSNYRR